MLTTTSTPVPCVLLFAKILCGMCKRAYPIHADGIDDAISMMQYLIDIAIFL